MGGLNTALMIGVGGLDVAQGALDATSNNIANVNTPGYTREEAQISELPENESGGEVTGGGVTLDGLQSIRDELLNLQINTQTSVQSAADARTSSLDQVQQYFTTSGADIASELSGFSSSLVELTASPTSASAQQGVIASGQDLAQAFNSTAKGLTGVQTEAAQQAPDTVSQINALTAQIAQLNGQLAEVPASANGGTTQDQLDQDVQQLAGLTNISVTQTNGGGETITTGSGTPLVIGSQSYNLQASTGANGTVKILDSTGNDITASITGGTLGGTLTIANSTIPSYLSQLNTLASQFAKAVNAAQTSGTDASGAKGADFFSGTTNLATAAADMKVNITTASQLAVNSSATSAGSNIGNLSSAVTGALSSGKTASAAYASIVFNVGTDASNASAQSTAAGDNLTQLTTLQGSVSAVSIDEETANLMRYQTAYEAASRIVSTVQVLDNAALNMGSGTSF